MTINPGNEYLLDGVIDKNKRMVELGNQTIIRKNKLGKDYHFNTSKSMYAASLLEHVSLDLNAKDGAVKVNLSDKLEEWNNHNFYNRFDIVTNFGTSEHCSNQNNVFYNIDCLCKIGGIMIHSVPLDGYWPNHCRFRYKLGFFTKLSNKLGYEITIEETKSRKKNLLLNAIMTKKKNNSYSDFNLDFSTIGITIAKNYDLNTDNDAERMFL